MCINDIYKLATSIPVEPDYIINANESIVSALATAGDLKAIDIIEDTEERTIPSHTIQRGTWLPNGILEKIDPQTLILQ